MVKIRGAKELRAAIKRAGPELRAEATKEVRASTKRMHQMAQAGFNSASALAPFWHGKSGMQSITGAARRNYRMSVTKDGMTGRVGLLTGTALKNAFYLKYFLFGTSHQPARNVHDLAFEAEAPDFITNQGLALERVLRRMG